MHHTKNIKNSINDLLYFTMYIFLTGVLLKFYIHAVIKVMAYLYPIITGNNVAVDDRCDTRDSGVGSRLDDNELPSKLVLRHDCVHREAVTKAQYRNRQHTNNETGDQFPKAHSCWLAGNSH